MSKKPDPELIDDDNPEWTEEDFKKAIRFSDLPESLQAKLRRGRGPNRAPTKEQISIRLSSETVQYFRATGEGWQTRIDEALREWVKARRAA
ncbi:MAG: BrnA antitoxin family protein [Betaproteobacteria bacterium]|nr:BrnA antitoxin family protein [Betaproteobacteria bacterium]